MKQVFSDILVTPEHAGTRLDIFLSSVLGMSRTQTAKMIEIGEIVCENKVMNKPSFQVRQGMVFRVQPVLVEKISEKKIDQREEIFPDIPVIQETEDYLIINKPSGLLVHETEAHETMTLARWLLQKYPQLQGVGENPVRPGIVHRLDKEASGLIIVAKTQSMFEALKQQFKERTIEKEYRILVHEVVESDEGVIDFAIDRGKDGKMVSRPRMDLLSLQSLDKAQEGKEARTEFFVLKRFINYTLLSVRIHSGRTHQIRVHFFAYNHPVVGDPLYFQKRFDKFEKGISRIFLHAYRLRFTDLSGESIEVISPIPQELEDFLKVIVG